MKTADYLASMYHLIEKRRGPVAARQSVKIAVNLVIADIQDEGLDITSEEIEKRIALYVQDFIEVDRKNNAA